MSGITQRRRWLFSLVVVMVSIAFAFSGGSAHAQTPPPIGGGDPPSQQTASAYFSNLTFSVTADGPAMTVFPAGTRQVFARFNYANVPVGVVFSRQWYRNGALYLNRSEVWNAAYGSSGYLSTLSIYDLQNGLPAGNYQVVFSLNGYTSSPIYGAFVIQGGVVYPTAFPNPTAVPTGMALYNMTTSTSPGGATMTYYPAGTRAVYLRFDYANIPIGTVMRREWYRENVLFTVAQDTWSAYWGSYGRLTHISLYDYTNGLTAGTYRVRVYLASYPSVAAETTFVIGGGAPTPQVFSGMTFSSASNGPAYSYFPYGTKIVFVRWNYSNPPTGVTLVRRWYRNSVLWLERREGWYRSGNGSVYASVWDYQYGLQPGNYYVEISLEGIANSTITGYFRVG